MDVLQGNDKAMPLARAETFREQIVGHYTCTNSPTLSIPPVLTSSSTATASLPTLDAHPLAFNDRYVRWVSFSCFVCIMLYRRYGRRRRCGC